MNWQPDLLRLLLLSATTDDPPDLSAYDSSTIAAHVDLLVKAGLACRSRHPGTLIGGLTYDGMKLLRYASCDIVWQHAANVAVEAVDAVAGVVMLGTLRGQLIPPPSDIEAEELEPVAVGG